MANIADVQADAKWSRARGRGVRQRRAVRRIERTRIGLRTGPDSRHGQEVGQIERMQNRPADIGVRMARDGGEICLHCVDVLNARTEAQIEQRFARLTRLLHQQIAVGMHHHHARGVIAEADLIALRLTHGTLRVFGHFQGVEVDSAASPLCNTRNMDHGNVAGIPRSVIGAAMEMHDRNALQVLLSLPTLPRLPDEIARALGHGYSRPALWPFRPKPARDPAATHYETWRSRFQRAALDDRQEIGKYLDSLHRDADREKGKAAFLRHRAQIKASFRSVESALDAVATALLGKPGQSSLMHALENTKEAFLLARDDLARAERTVREIDTSALQQWRINQIRGA
jgi:hypothetical protein